jgi:hypothetical protein
MSNSATFTTNSSIINSGCCGGYGCPRRVVAIVNENDDELLICSPTATSSVFFYSYPATIRKFVVLLFHDQINNSYL